ncbi:MAG TPA: pyridoxal-dependent decarboxylase [Gemmatimonadales bacterium]
MKPTPATPALGDMPVEQFRAAGHQLIDDIANLWSRWDEVPVTSARPPGALRDALPSTPPRNGESIDAILDDVQRQVLPHMTHWTHPSFFAYFVSSGSGPGILGELLATTLNPNCMTWLACPAGTELEQVTLDWFRQMLGLPDAFRGVIYEGASSSSYYALAAAMASQDDLEIRERGMAGRADLPPLAVYTSVQAHSSIEKAAIGAGLGQQAVRKIPLDGDFRMSPHALAEAIAADRTRGVRPLAVVATAGTTSTSAIDPVPALADICAREKVWLHVDAAYGGSAAIAPEFRHVLAGAERADSVVVNPHKWLFVPLDLSAFYTTRPETLVQAFSLLPAYLRDTSGAGEANYMDYGLTLGRRFRALKLWFVLRYFGWDGLAARIRANIELARRFAGWIDDHPTLVRVAPVPLGLVCFRLEPPGVTDAAELNALNQRLLGAINASHEVLLTHTELDGRFVIRFVVGSIRTEPRHVERAWAIVRRAAERLANPA